MKVTVRECAERRDGRERARTSESRREQRQRLAHHLKQVVDVAPVLSQAQRSGLANLLRGGSS